MSTKIYNAFRVKKEVNLRELLDRMKNVATDMMAQDGEYLYLLHALSVARAADFAKHGNGGWLNRAQAVLNENEKNDFGFDSLYWMERCMKEADSKMEQDLMSIRLDMSLWPDGDYWYIKFFVNWGMPQRMMNAVETACPELEDYHYQNQTDIPDGIDEVEFESRSSKWDELTKPDGNYRNMLQFVIFDHNDFMDLIRRNWWKGEKDVYRHLAYKFDKNVELKDETNDEESVQKETQK